MADKNLLKQAQMEMAKRELAKRQGTTSASTTGAGTPGGMPGSHSFSSNPINWSTSKLPGATTGQAIGSWWAGNMPSWLGGAPDNAKKNVAPGPTLEQVGGDVLKSGAIIGGLAAAPATIPGAMLAGGVVGAAQGAGGAMEANAPASAVAKQGGIGAVVGATTAGVVSGVLKLVGSIGSSIVFSKLKPVQADFEDGLPKTPGALSDLLKKYNIDGSLQNMLGQTQTNIGDFYSQLKTIEGGATPIDLTSVYDKTAQDITSGVSGQEGSQVKNILKQFGTNTKMTGALEQLQNEVLAVNPSGKMPVADAQIVKQAAGGMGSWQYGKLDPEATALQSVYNSFYRNLKTAIEDASPPGITELNGKMQELIPLQNALVRRIPIVQRQATIGLGDFIALSAAAINPSALPLEIANIASKSAWFGNLLSGASRSNFIAQEGSQAIAPTLGGSAAAMISPSASAPTQATTQ